MRSKKGSVSITVTLLEVSAILMMLRLQEVVVSSLMLTVSVSRAKERRSRQMQGHMMTTQRDHTVLLVALEDTSMSRLQTTTKKTQLMQSPGSQPEVDMPKVITQQALVVSLSSMKTSIFHSSK